MTPDKINSNSLPMTSTIKIRAYEIDKYILRRRKQDIEDNLYWLDRNRTMPNAEYTRTQFAKELGITRANLHHIINKSQCTYERLVDISKIIGIPVDALMEK